MLVFLGFYLYTLLSPALGQTIPETDQTNSVPDSEGDLFFLLDSSGSVTYDEFAKVKEFIGDLLRPFKFGPQDVQASVVQISTDPTLEFPLNQYSSNQDVQKSIQNIRQRMGDTNTGKALDFVKDNLHAKMFGSRADVPKVMMWVTDGLSTDDISQPMQLLKDMGVTVFIICTTGRGNFEDLSAAASQPDEKYLKFVDKDDLGIITKELRDSIIELIQAKRLQVLDITDTGFRLNWPRLLSRDTGHYVLEYTPVADPRRKLHHTVSGDQTSLVIGGLTPNTTYQVTLIPESNIDYIHTQTINVSTLQELKEERNLEAFDITTSGFRLTWSRLSGDTGSYVIEYSPVSDPRRKFQKTLSGDVTSVEISALIPNTTYQVTLIPDPKVQYVQPEAIQVSTLPNLIQARNLQVLNITASSLNLTWLRLPGDAGRYLLDYAPVLDPRRKLRKTLYGDHTSVVISGLTPNTAYLITFIPESNLQYIQSQKIKVSTLSELKEERNLEPFDITTSGFRLTWSRLSRDTGRYVIEYSPVSDPRIKFQKTLSGDVTNVELSALIPNTTYQVILIPDSNVQYVQPEAIQVSTLPGDAGRYLLDYAPVSDPRSELRKTLYGDHTSVVISGLTPNTTYLITFIHESNLQYIQSQKIQVSTLPKLKEERNLEAFDITATGFRLTWSRLSGDTGSYVIEYSPVFDPRKKFQKTLYGDVTSVEISALIPNTTYQVTLIPDSNVQYVQPETIQVSTIPEPIRERNLQALDITTTSVLVTWSRLSGDGGSYVLEYSPVSDPRGKLRKTLSGDESSVVLSNLTPNTTYQITLIPDSIAQFVQYGTIQFSTLVDLIQARNLLVSKKTSTSFQLAWSRLFGDTGRYIVEYAPLGDLRRKMQKTIYGDQTSVVFSSLTPNTMYQVTFIPESNEQFIQSQTIQVSTLPELKNQTRNLQVWDITTTGFQLTWSRLPRDKGPYILEYALVSDPKRKHRMTLPADRTNVMLSSLNPNTQYQATLFSEASVQYVPPQTIQISTLQEQLGPAQILISDPSAHSFRVSWGPSLDSVAGYEIQYGPLPSNAVQTVLADGSMNSTVLEGLKSNTTYLVTVSAIFKSGGEKALSAIACTEKNDSKVKYLQFGDLGLNSLKASWGSADGEVQGYRVRCRRQAGHSSLVSVAPQTHSVHLTDLPEGTTNKICVLPVYKNGGGKSLCRKVQIQPGTSANRYSRIRTQ